MKAIGRSITGHTARRQGREALIYLVSLGLVLLALPLVGLLVFTGRAVFLGGLGLVALGGLAVAVSPGFRSWWQSRSTGQASISGIRLAHDVALHPAHAWTRLEDGEMVVGADDLMQATLGPVEEVELPPSGHRVRAGQTLFRLRRGERAVDVRSPVSGTVRSCNEALRQRPELVNQAPFAAGWVVRLDGEGPRRQRRALLRGGEARAWLRGEVDHLLASLVTEPAGAASLPDGGAVVGELHEHIDDATWRRLSRTFFTGREA